VTATGPENGEGCQLTVDSIAVARRCSRQYTDAESSLVYMRARYYDPATAKWISLDPLAAISGSPYGYVDRDPLNGSDPTGLLCLDAHCLLNDAKHAANTGYHAGRFAATAPATAAGAAYATVVGGGDCDFHGSEMQVVCTNTGNIGNHTFTVGSTVLSNQNQDYFQGNRRLAHEAKHSDQWYIFGPSFPVLYGIASGYSEITKGNYGCGNVFEWWAGFKDGDYNNCGGGPLAMSASSSGCGDVTGDSRTFV